MSGKAALRRGLLAAAGAALSLPIACGGAASSRIVGGVAPGAAGGAQPAGLAGRRPVTSNILRRDYVGSEACEPCHAAIYAGWLHSPMHEMTRSPETARVRAPFDGAEFHFKDDRARFEQRGGERFVRVSSAELGSHLYRVSKVIGGRYREDYAGVEVADLDAGEPARAPTAELLLPVSYVFESRAFRLKGYSVMVGERPGLRAGGVWNQTCVFCHNTTPYFDSTWGELFGPGAPGYQGTVVDRLLPVARRWSFEVTDGAGLVGALRGEIERVGGAAPAAPPSEDADGAAASPEARRRLLNAGMRTLRQRLTPEHFVEIGIGCESCHGGSREHVDDARVQPDFSPRSPFLRARPPEGHGAVTRAESINRTCARCHQVLFSRYPFTWEGGARHGASAPEGGSSITSGEARDFLLGGCAAQMSCTTCHDPHAEDRPDKLARLQSPAGNPICTGCHSQYRESEALRRHAHHDPAGAAGACLACHMPRKNMGLGYRLTRYHRIGSPTDRARVERDRPLECALCHVDRTVGGLVADMERWWGKRYDRAALVGLYGGAVDLDVNALLATVERGKPHEQAPAMAALGEHRVAAALPAIARQLTHPIPLVRYYAQRAVDAIRGAPCAIDLDRATPAIEAAARRCVPEAFAVIGGSGRPPPPRAAPRAADADED